jgi:hypothetical protein
MNSISKNMRLIIKTNDFCCFKYEKLFKEAEIFFPAHLFFYNILVVVVIVI